MRASLVKPTLMLATTIWTLPALAESMDPAIERLVLDSNCRRSNGEINLPVDGSDYIPCQPDTAAFTKLAAQYAFAFAPTAMHSARTTGIGGFHLALEAAYTSIDSGQSYWEQGTQGKDDPTTNQASVRNTTPQGILQLYSIKLRKSFGYGFEITGQTGVMPKTSMWSMGADIRLSLFEGFRKGAVGFILDSSFGGGVRTITGTNAFQLTVASLDAQVSKAIPVQDALVLTPWVGYQHLWIFADSNVVDLTPATDEETMCNAPGLRLPGQYTDNSDGVTTADDYDGYPACDPTSRYSGVDFDNNRSFGEARLARERLLIGASVQHESIVLGLQYVVDVISPEDAQSSSTTRQALAGMPRQWSAVVDLGVLF
jgi:hypothetical protein